MMTLFEYNTHLVAGLDSPGDAILVQHLVDALVQHEGAAVDRAQAGEALGHAAQAVHRVDVRALAVSLQGERVQLDGLRGRLRRLETGNNVGNKLQGY